MDLETKLSITDIYKSDNIADLLSEHDQICIAEQCLVDLEIDQQSRAEWDQISKEALKIVKQVTEKKNRPFKNASNVKYPLVAVASIQYAARAYPEFIR